MYSITDLVTLLGLESNAALRDTLHFNGIVVPALSKVKTRINLNYARNISIVTIIRDDISSSAAKGTISVPVETAATHLILQGMSTRTDSHALDRNELSSSQDFLKGYSLSRDSIFSI